MLELKGFQFTDFKSLDSEQTGLFTGYLSTFGNVDHDNDVMSSKAFNSTLMEWKAKSQLPALRWNHDPNEPVGDYLSMQPDNAGLKVRGLLHMDGKVPPTQATIKAYRVVTGTGPKGMSVGFIARKSSKRGDGVREILDVDLMEGSIVQFAANEACVILSAKSRMVDDSGAILDVRSMEKILRDAGLSVRQSKAFLSGGYSNLMRDARALVDDESTMRYLEDTAARLSQMMNQYNLSLTDASASEG